jgi:hypothetical protein
MFACNTGSIGTTPFFPVEQQQVKSSPVKNV